MKYNRIQFNVGYIYKIQNRINGKIYIGQTVKPTIRPYMHLNKPESTNQRFRSSIKCHGKDNFEVSILCECYSRDDLDWAERFYIMEWYDSTHNSRGYNLRTEKQGDHYLSQATDEERIIYFKNMKIAQNNPEVNKRRGTSISKTKQTDFWKWNRKPSITFPNYKEYMSTIQKESMKRPEVKEALSQSQIKRWSNLELRCIQSEAVKIGKQLTPDHIKRKDAELSRQTMLRLNQDPEWRRKSNLASAKARATSEFKEKHKASHNTESCKQKVREAQIHPLRKFIEEHWFVIKEKYPVEFNVHELFKRFGLDYTDTSMRQATRVGFSTLIHQGLLMDSGFYSFSRSGRCKKFKWI